MDFTFTEEQSLMADSLRKAYESDYDFDRRRAFLDDTATFHSPAMWQTLAENGFIGLLAPEEAGGFDGGGAEIMALATEMSRHLALEPFLATSVMGVRLLVSAGTDAQKSNILPQVVAGDANMAVALYEPGQRYDVAPQTTTTKADGDGFVLNGAKAVVVGGDSARWIAIGAKLEDVGSAVFMVDAGADGVSSKPYRLVDGRGAADVELTDVRVGADARMAADDAETALAEIEDWAVTASLAETVGAMEMARDLTHEYLQTREQFGRPIGKFQVLQHSMADVFSDVEFARSMVFWAASEVANPDATVRRHAVSGAKAFVDKAARNIAERCVQMHGGVGVTDEYALTHYVKRLTLGQVLFGDRDEHLLRYTETDA